MNYKAGDVVRLSERFSFVDDTEADRIWFKGEVVVVLNTDFTNLLWVLYPNGLCDIEWACDVKRKL